jgi:anti-sigma factor RsiW
VEEFDCQTIREILDPYLDNELLVETSQSVLDHLRFCTDCAAESERRIELRRLLRDACTVDDEERSHSETLSRRRTELALDQQRRSRWTAKIRWAPLAAGLILALGVFGYWQIGKPLKPANSPGISPPTSTPTVLIAAVDREAVENHQVCALSYPSNWTYNRERIVRELTPTFASLIDVVGRNHGKYELIEGHICSYQQKQYAHLIFRGNGRTVSVFIQPDNRVGDPKSSHPVEIEQGSYTAYQFASADTGIHRIYVVSDLPNNENRALANQLFPPALGFVKKLELNAG